jgi:hypothetical protein
MAKVLERNEHDPESDDFDWLLKREELILQTAQVSSYPSSNEITSVLTK